MNFDNNIDIFFLTAANPCLSSPCDNGGTCQEDGDSYKCFCADGFNGTNCEDFVGDGGEDGGEDGGGGNGGLGKTDEKLFVLKSTISIYLMLKKKKVWFCFVFPEMTF